MIDGDPYAVSDTETPEEALRSMISSWVEDEGKRRIMLVTLEELAGESPEAGLPPDLLRILRDPTITIDRDHQCRLADGRTLFEHLEEWRNAPSNTAGERE